MKQRTCAHCGHAPRQFSLFWFGSDFAIDRRDMRVLCHACVKLGWKLDEAGIARHDPARVVDGGVRRAVDGLVRAIVGIRKDTP